MTLHERFSQRCHQLYKICSFRAFTPCSLLPLLPLGNTDRSLCLLIETTSLNYIAPHAPLGSDPACNVFVRLLDRMSLTGPHHPEPACARITKSPSGAPSPASLPKIPERLFSFVLRCSFILAFPTRLSAREYSSAARAQP